MNFWILFQLFEEDRGERQERHETGERLCGPESAVGEEHHVGQGEPGEKCENSSEALKKGASGRGAAGGEDIDYKLSIFVLRLIILIKY